MKVETSAETVMVVGSSTDSNGEEMVTDRSSVVGPKSSEIPCLSVVATPKVMETSPVYMQTSSVVVAKPFVASDFVAYLHLLAQSLPSILECCTSTDRSQVSSRLPRRAPVGRRMAAEIPTSSSPSAKSVAPRVFRRSMTWRNSLRRSGEGISSPCSAAVIGDASGKR